MKMEKYQIINKKNFKTILIAIIAAFLLAFVFINIINVSAFGAVGENGGGNLTEKENAKLALQNIKAIMAEMQGANFSILRINDTLQKASQIYAAQEALEIKKGKADYSLILNYEQEIISLKESAYNSRDELFSLEKSLESLKERDINVSEAEGIISQIRQEINDERYDQALQLSNTARDKLAEIEASATAFNVFYNATKRTALDFFKENYITLIIIIAAVIVFYFVFEKRIFKMIIKIKIKNLNFRKENLKKLIQNTQKDYFQYGEISESTYSIKTKKFAELIRDIDRQIPLLQEELTRLGEKEKN